MDSSHILVAFEGAKKTISHQAQTLNDELNIFDISTTEVSGDEPLRFLTRLQLASEEDHLPSRFLVECYLSPSTTAEFLTQQRQRFPHHISEPLNGIVRIFTDHLDDLTMTTPRVVRRAPTDWKTPERVFGKPTPAFELMRHIKRTLDPDGVFNPGRMF
jgi:hypothetical protein